MTSYMCDPFQVKKLQRLVKRELTELERMGEMPVRWKDTDGRVQFEWVKRYSMKDFYSR